MKKKYIALLLSVAIAFSSVPVSTLNAAPAGIQSTTSSNEATTNELQSVSLEEATKTEPFTEEGNNEIPESSSEISTSDIETSEEETTEASEHSTEEDTVSEETTEPETITENTEETTIVEPSEVSTEYESVPTPTESDTEQSEAETSCETLSSEEEGVLICEDTICIPFSNSYSNEITDYYSANATLETDLFSEEMINSVPYVELYTLLQNEDAFRSQLTEGFETTFYDAGKKCIVENGYNYINLSNLSTYNKETQWEEVCNAISALAATYPNKFNWINWANVSLKRQVIFYSKSGTYTDKYILSKSKHYSSTLEKNTDAKVKTLVTEANAYAKENYPDSPAYAIIVYLNDWLCENNYFEKEHGLSDEPNIQNGKIYYYSHTCYGPLLYGYGTSEGYALAMSRLLDEAGIRNLYVTGSYNGEEYAWNYVEMPNGYWYLVDTLRNDIECNDSDYKYLLVQPDDTYKADSRKWKTFLGSEIGTKLDYDAIITAATEDYISETSEAEQTQTLAISDETVVLKPKQKYQLSLNDNNTVTGNYYEKFVKTWSSDNTKVAKLDSTGKITAGTTPGKATITVKAAGKEFTSTVYVYQFTNIKFSANNKTSYTAAYTNPDTVFDEEDMQTIELDVNQKNYQITAYDIVSGNNLNEVRAVSSKPHIAKVESVTLKDDTITLNVLPQAVGSAKITITLAGKKAYYTINITQDLQEEWFDYSNIEPENPEDSEILYTYSGKSFKPSIPLTESGRDCSPKATYKITYSNNKNAGKATITITGTGKYSGTIVKNFTIQPKDMSTAVFRSCTSSRTYNAKPRAASTNVRLVKTTLKAGRDYTVQYKRTDVGFEDSLSSDTVPTEAGTYEVSIIAKGNYTGELTETKTYTIKPNSIKNMTVSYRSSVKYTGEPVSVLKNVKISGNLLPDDNYIVTYQDSAGTISSIAPVEKGKYKLIITPVEDKNITTTLTKTCIKKPFTIK